MSLLDRENFIEILEQLRTRQCAYSHDKQAPICDCKFHHLGAKLTTKSEVSNGCPELLWIIIHLKGMSDKEYEKFRLGGRKRIKPSKRTKTKLPY
jgi:hypothetical protein